MKIIIDKNNLLTIDNENIPKTKEYTYHVNGYLFSDFDKGIIVLHKKQWKIINLKNLGDNMNVVYIKKNKGEIINEKGNGSIQSLKLFHGFDENTGKTYYFIPGLKNNQQEQKNNIFKKLSIPYNIQKTSKGMIIDPTPGENKIETIQEIIEYIFGTLLIYGKFEGKNQELTSIKIQIPLFGQYLAHQETLDLLIKKLQQNGIFLKVDKLSNNNGITYQISSNDYELLEIFAKWYEPVEKFEKITKRDFTDKMKTKLLEFIQNNSEIPQDGKSEVLNQIQTGTIKLLMK